MLIHITRVAWLSFLCVVFLFAPCLGSKNTETIPLEFDGWKYIYASEHLSVKENNTTNEVSMSLEGEYINVVFIWNKNRSNAIRYSCSVIIYRSDVPCFNCRSSNVDKLAFIKMYSTRVRDEQIVVYPEIREITTSLIKESGFIDKQDLLRFCTVLKYSVGLSSDLQNNSELVVKLHDTSVPEDFQWEYVISLTDIDDEVISFIFESLPQ